jgi:ubiquinone biosynthesis UbiH/UbiF/VisC/COQ6 family hydroxylase
MSDPRATDVAVIGSGVAGMAAALGLSQLGLRVTLVGPVSRVVPPSPAFDARVYALSPASLRLLQQLRAWSQVDPARVQKVERMRVFGDAGEELSFDAYATAVERLATVAEERELLRVLALGVDMAPGISRQLAPMQSLRSHAAGVDVVLADGRSLQAQLVIGADGADSDVRTAAGLTAEVVSYGQTAVVMNLAIEQQHEGVAWQWFTDEGVVALLPLPGRAVSLVWSAPDALAQQLHALAPQELAERVGRRVLATPNGPGTRLGALQPLGAGDGATSRAHAFRLRRLRVDRLTAAGVALIGDAAHVVHPLAGQGLNLGLQDVSMLLDTLRMRESWRSVGDAVVLRRYARRRAEAIDLMRWTTDGLARLFAWDDPLVRRARNAGMAALNAVGPLKRALIRHAMG